MVDERRNGYRKIKLGWITEDWNYWGRDKKRYQNWQLVGDYLAIISIIRSMVENHEDSALRRF